MNTSQINSAPVASAASADVADKESSNIPPPPPPPPAAPKPKPEEEEDDEIKLAMEMAIAAAQNPNLSPDELRKLVGGKNRQSKIVDEVQQQKEKQKEIEREEAAKRWEEKKQRAYAWFKGTTSSISEGAAAVKLAAEKKAEEMQFNAEKQLYADQIRRDPQTREIRKHMKLIRKTLKAQRLNGNRVETRHLFKRQRMEKTLLETSDKLEKTRALFCETNYQVTEYAKAMMRASKKWKRKGTDEDLKLEAQLCRNMHQMLALEKQKSKVKKSTREIKKYLQRCKGWLSDKQALCEMHGLTLDATTSSMKVIYQETLSKQDALIARLKEEEEFKDVDLSEWEGSHLFDTIPKEAGPAATLNALRGLPFRDSIRVTKDHQQEGGEGLDVQAAVAAATAAAAPEAGARPANPQSSNYYTRTGKAPELYVTTNADDDSVNSALSDPDGDDELDDKLVHSMSASSLEFGADAPWMQEPEKEKKKTKSPPASAAAPADDTKPAAKKDGKPASKKKESSKKDTKKAPPAEEKKTAPTKSEPAPPTEVKAEKEEPEAPPAAEAEEAAEEDATETDEKEATPEAEAPSKMERSNTSETEEEAAESEEASSEGTGQEDE